MHSPTLNWEPGIHSPTPKYLDCHEKITTKIPTGILIRSWSIFRSWGVCSPGRVGSQRPGFRVSGCITHNQKSRCSQSFSLSRSSCATCTGGRLQEFRTIRKCMQMCTFYLRIYIYVHTHIYRHMHIPHRYICMCMCIHIYIYVNSKPQSQALNPKA